MDQGLIDNTQNFGAKLKSARELAGFDLETIARRLHIRPDIVRSIENSDFDNMPAHGYAKNMIRSYARTVGLNQNEICDQYAQELNSHNRTLQRMEEDALGGTSRRRSTRTSFLDLSSEGTQREERHSGRSFVDSKTREAKARVSSRGASNESRSRRGAGAYYSNAGTRNHVKTKSMSSTYSLGKVPHPSIPSFDFQKLIVPGIVILIIILVILIFSLIFGNKASSTQDDVPTMPISGLTDTSNKDTASSDSSQQTKSDHATFKVEVSSGQQSWCIVTLDGTTSFSDIISGPDSKTYEVKGQLEFETANSGPVKIYIDNKEQTLTADSTTGMYVFSYTYDSNKTSTQ